MTKEIITISLIGIIPVIAGIYLGGMLRHKLSEERFRIAVLIILIFIGINLIIYA